MGWYVVETNPNSEYAVQDRVTVLGPPTFLAEMRRTKRAHKRNASPFILLFPRYIFVQLDLPSDKDLVGIIRRFEGVKSLLGMSAGRELPMQVRDKDVARLQEVAAELSKEIVLCNDKPAPLQAETVVRVLGGLFDGMVGTVKFDNGIRADVLLAAAGVATKTNLPREMIEALR